MMDTFLGGDGRGGRIELLTQNGGSLEVANGSLVFAATLADPVDGDPTVRGGDIIVRTGDLVVKEDSALVTFTDGDAMPAGGIDIEADTLRVFVAEPARHRAGF